MKKKKQTNIFIGISLIYIAFIIFAFYQASQWKKESSVSQVRLPELPPRIFVIQIEHEWQKEVVDSFIDIAIDYKLDPRLLVAMAKLESQLCTRIIPGTNNCFGIVNGELRFKSYKDGAIYAAELITANAYYKKFQETGRIKDLGKVWAADSYYTQKLKIIMNNF